MSRPLLYSRPTDRLFPTWSVATGTAKTGYGVDKINTTNLTTDPSEPLWIDETSIRITGNLGSAQEVTAVAIIGHSFSESANVRFQMNSSPTWTTPPVDVALTVRTRYLNGERFNPVTDLVAAIPLAASRTYQYISIANLTTNNRDIAIGEVWIAGASGWRQLHILHTFEMIPDSNVVAMDRSRKDVQVAYDYGVRENRGFSVEVLQGLSEENLWREWYESAHGVALPSLVVLDLDETSTDRRFSEARLVRFSEFKSVQSLAHRYAYSFSASFEDYGQGEPLS